MSVHNSITVLLVQLALRSFDMESDYDKVKDGKGLGPSQKPIYFRTVVNVIM